MTRSITSHALARRLPGRGDLRRGPRRHGLDPEIPGVPAGTPRGAQLTDSARGAAQRLPRRHSAGLPRESACECERTSELRLGAVMSLISGPTIADAIADGGERHRQARSGRGRLEAHRRDLHAGAQPARASRRDQAGARGDRRHPGGPQDLTGILGRREEEWKVPRAQAPGGSHGGDRQGEGGADAPTRWPSLRASPSEEKHRQENIAKKEAELKDYESPDDAPSFPEWEKTQQAAASGSRSCPRSSRPPTARRSRPSPTCSVIATGKNRKGNYVITAQTSLKGIKQIRLEALEDTRIPTKGPGRARRTATSSWCSSTSRRRRRPTPRRRARSRSRTRRPASASRTST